MISYMPITDTVNDTVTHVQEKNLQFIGFYHNVVKTFAVLLVTRTKITFCAYIGTQNGSYNISREAFTVCRKSMKAFSCVALIMIVRDTDS